MKVGTLKELARIDVLASEIESHLGQKSLSKDYIRWHAKHISQSINKALEDLLGPQMGGK